MIRRMMDFSSAIVTRVSLLRGNPQHSGVEIITPLTISRCEIFLEESKARYPLEPHSPAVLMTVALQASSKNQKRPLITITESKEGLLYDVKHDPPPPRKKRKLRIVAGPRNNNVALASNTRAEATEKEDDLMRVDTGEVENNNN